MSTLPLKSRILTILQCCMALIYVSALLAYALCQPTIASFTLFSLILFITILTLYFVASHLIQKRLNALTCIIQYCSAYNEESPPPSCDSRDLTQLKDAISKLIARNESLLEQEQMLFKEAAHELKSPIAIMNSRLALYKEESDYEKGQFVQELSSDIKRITNVLRELLFIKSVRSELNDAHNAVDIVAQCDTLHEEFMPIVKQRNLEVEPIRHGSFTITTNEKALQSILLALFENIFIHAKEGSKITVEVDAVARTLTITNAIDSKPSEVMLFPSHIGMQIIKRLTPLVNANCHVQKQESHFITTLQFS